MTTGAAVIELIGRVLFALLFLGAGMFHLRMPAATAREYTSSVGFPLPVLATWPTGLWLLLAGLSIALGIWPDIGALMAAVFVTIAGAFFHRFWTVEDPEQKQFQMQNFMRNLSLLGASLALFAYYATLGDDGGYLIVSPLFEF